VRREAGCRRVVVYKSFIFLINLFGLFDDFCWVGSGGGVMSMDARDHFFLFLLLFHCISLRLEF
jgi:hypothetical protein